VYAARERTMKAKTLVIPNGRRVNWQRVEKRTLERDSPRMVPLTMEKEGGGILETINERRRGGGNNGTRPRVFVPRLTCQAIMQLSVGSTS